MVIKSHKKWTVVVVVLMAVVLVAAACGDEATPTSAPATATPAPPGVTPPPATPTSVAPTATPSPTSPPVSEKPFEGESLIVTAYAGPFYDAFTKVIIPVFEEDTGATVELIPTYGEEMTTILSAPADKPPFDVVGVWNPSVIQGVAEGVLLPLRVENIPNFKDVTDFHRQFGVIDGVVYGAPFEFGFFGIAYDKEALGFTPTSWDDLWRPEAQGKIGLDSVFWWKVLGTPAMAMDLAPDLDELYTDEGLSAVLERLGELDVAFWYDSGAAATAAMDRGDIAIALELIEIVAPLVLQDPDKYGFVVPGGKSGGYVDYMAVVRGTEKRDLAEVWLNYILDPELQALWAEEVPYYLSNSKVEYGPFAQQFLPETQEERLSMGIMYDWDYLLEHWTEIEERLKKEVITQ